MSPSTASVWSGDGATISPAFAGSCKTVPLTGASMRVFSSRASATATSERAACSADSSRFGAGMFGFDRRPLFRADPEATEAPTVDLGVTTTSAAPSTTAPATSATG